MRKPCADSRGAPDGNVRTKFGLGAGLAQEADLPTAITTPLYMLIYSLGYSDGCFEC